MALSLTSRFPFFPLVITSGTSIGAQCSSIDFAFRSTAWPLIVLEKHCKLWGKGSLLTRLPSWVSAAACAGVDELSQGSAAAASPARGSILPLLLRPYDWSSGSDALYAHGKTRRETGGGRVPVWSLPATFQRIHLAARNKLIPPRRLCSVCWPPSGPLLSHASLLLGNLHYTSSSWYI